MLNIIVIEDYDDTREAIVMVLTEAGHQVIGLPSAEEMDDGLIDFIPDLYIIDLNLPGEDGISLMQRILRHQSNARIIITSARTNIQDRIAGYQHGASIYLAKPLVLEELKAVVNSLGQRIISENSASDHTAVLNQQKLTFIGPFGEAQLTRQEAILICAFSKAAQQTLEHWQVTQHLGEGNNITRENVEMRIVRLRKKLIACGISAPAIQVIRKYGYRLCFIVKLKTSNPARPPA